MIAYVQKGMKNWNNEQTAIRGLRELGHWVEEVPHLELEHIGEHIYYGNVGFTRTAARCLRYKPRWIGHVPEALYPLAGRKIENVPLATIVKGKINKFIKPTPDKNKSFNGFVYTGDQMEQLFLVNYFLSEEELVIASDVVNFVSEWRCYIHKGEIFDGKHYKGDFRVAPDYTVADKAAELWTDAPAAWSCDIGVTDKGETLIVECNDVMSLGVYGLAPIYLGRMLESRWEEIHKNKSL